MPNPWFKFYGMEYLSDQKMLSLNACHRSCWITLLCYASQTDGVIKYLDEDCLMRQAGIEFQDDYYAITKGVLKLFEKLGMIRIDNGMITILNWNKRQERQLTGYERVKKYREKQKEEKQNDNALITNDNALITLDKKKIRIDKNKIKKESPTSGDGKEIAEIIFLFKAVNPMIQKLYGMPPQRKAVERMLKEFGREKLEVMINALPQINGQQYWPKSTTPVQLENNIAYYQAKKSEMETKQEQSKIKVALIQ